MENPSQPLRGFGTTGSRLVNRKVLLATPETPRRAEIARRLRSDVAAEVDPNSGATSMIVLECTQPEWFRAALCHSPVLAREYDVIVLELNGLGGQIEDILRAISAADVPTQMLVLDNAFALDKHQLLRDAGAAGVLLSRSPVTSIIDAILSLAAQPAPRSSAGVAPPDTSALPLGNGEPISSSAARKLCDEARAPLASSLRSYARTHDESSVGPWLATLDDAAVVNPGRRPRVR